MTVIKETILKAIAHNEPLEEIGPQLVKAGIKPVKLHFDDYEAVRFPQQGTLHEAQELFQDGHLDFKQLQKVANSTAAAMAH